MQCGISTSCFYPQETAEALSALRGAGVETVEIFLNTFSELELSYTERLRLRVSRKAGPGQIVLHEKLQSGWRPKALRQAAE